MTQVGNNNLQFQFNFNYYFTTSIHILIYQFYFNIIVPNYRRWIRDIEELQTVKMSYSLMADPDCAVLSTVSALLTV